MLETWGKCLKFHMPLKIIDALRFKCLVCILCSVTEINNVCKEMLGVGNIWGLLIGLYWREWLRMREYLPPEQGYTVS